MTIVGGLKRIAQRTPLRSAVVSLRHRDVTSGDVSLASYPKSGNTWVRSMIATGILGMRPSRDKIGGVVPYIGFQSKCGFRTETGGRVIKTHETFRREYKTAVYLVRDWREVCVSYYYFEKRHGRFAGDLGQFAETFQRGFVDGFGRWSDHVSQWILAEREGKHRILIVRYEDVLHSPDASLERIFAHLGLETKLPFSKIAQLNSRENMLNDESSSMAPNSSVPFVRGGFLGQNLAEFREAVDGERQAKEFAQLNRQLGY